MALGFAAAASRLRAVNTHQKNYTKGKLPLRKAHVGESIARYLAESEKADNNEIDPTTLRISRLTERLAALLERFGGPRGDRPAVSQISFSR